MNTSKINTVLLAAILLVLAWNSTRPKPRFQIPGGDWNENAALDTYTGRVCLTNKEGTAKNPATGPNMYPYCWEIK